MVAMTVCPARANSSAVDIPMPELVPVISTVAIVIPFPEVCGARENITMWRTPRLASCSAGLLLHASAGAADAVAGTCGRHSAAIDHHLAADPHAGNASRRDAGRPPRTSCGHA